MAKEPLISSNLDNSTILLTFLFLILIFFLFIYYVRDCRLGYRACAFKFSCKSL